MFHSLRWQIIFAFSLIIILAVAISSVLAVWNTSRQFGELVTEAGLNHAARIALLLEAQYNLHGNLSPDTLIDESFEYDTTQSLSYYDVWEKSIAAELGLSLEEYKKTRHKKSIIELAQTYAIEPQALVSSIMRFEQLGDKKGKSFNFNDYDLNSDGLISPNEVDWYEKIRQFDRNKDGAVSLKEWEYGIGSRAKSRNKEGAIKKFNYFDRNSDGLILPNEVDWYEKIRYFDKNGDGAVSFEEWEIESKEKRLFTLAKTLDKANEYVNNSLSIQQIKEAWTKKRNYFLDTILEDSRMFITDEDGVVLFDSQKEELNGKQLDDEIMARGVAIHDWQDGSVVGHVIIAAGVGFYREDEERFLQSVQQLLFIGGLIAAILALIVGAIFARRITAPVTTLTDAAKRLAQGNHTTPLPVTSNDELGKMSQAFNTLTEALDTQRHLRRRLISDISHELNTPLSVIRLEMKALSDGLQSPLEASAQVVREINLLRSLANDLALLADTDKGVLSLNLEVVAISAFMETAISRWQAKAELSGITLQLETATNLPTIPVDPIRLNQVLGNLIENALQHTVSGGKILVSCRVEILPEKEGKWVIIAIRDTGCGIDPEDLPFVFERFYRADHSRQRQRGGRGLGLSIVKQIITLHEGIVWVDSQLGDGSTFSYALPVPV
ncbi:ATP-binding protein [Candidatus Halobeggiatoa sp. HSG11]|nr:ATP-binding protein [Candidatus Halobeggiatoa sp. HSG11]